MINFYEHGGSGNHGCEAIVRSSIDVLQKPVRLYSMHMDQDMQYGVQKVCEIKEDAFNYYSRGSIKWLVAAIYKRIIGNGDMATRFIRNNLCKSIKKGDVCFSIGGDNYCYPGTEELASVNRNLKSNGAQLVLWGCSVEPDLLEQDEVRKDIQQFDLIAARETISYEALKKVNPNTILVADPAFSLKKIELPLPEGWIEGNMIGINASPLILLNGKNGELVFEAYRQLIVKILETTECGVALIPHVVLENNDDRDILKKLYESVGDTKRVVLLPDANCMELKGYISRCRMFVGARTHSTIAAYSSCVPTLVLGYSVKSKGIARDLFGTEEKYVLPVQNMKNPEELTKGFEWLMNNEEKIREHLEKVIPQYVLNVSAANTAVERLFV